MSTNTEDEKDSPKAFPLDLARNISSVRTVEGKTPIVMTNQSLRGMRVLTQTVPGSNASSLGGPTIITTNLVSQAVLKPDSSRPQIAGIITSNTSQPQVTSNLSRPTQITLTTSQNIGTSYHVPRGPAVVANLAAPRSNVTTVRTPMVVAAQTGQPHTFVRPPRTPSPASGTAWLTNSSTGSQIKGAPTVLSSPVRGATVTGKPAVISRTQPQGVSTIRPGTILQNAISIGQPGQIHSFKAGTTGIQALGNTVTIAQVLPSRTQAVVYSANSNAQFTPARITVATTTSAPRPTQPRPLNQVTTARLTVPVNVSQSGSRLITPQATVLTSGARISAVTTTQPSTTLGTTTRIVTTQPNLSIGRLSVATATPTSVTNPSFLGQAKISTLNLHSLVAVANANAPQARTTIPTQGPKVITQPAQGTIQLTGTLATQIKTTPSIVSTGTRTISVPAAIVTQQRQATLVPSQAISIAKVFPQNENPAAVSTPTNVFIHTPVQSTRHSSPSPNPNNCITQTSSAIPTTTVATYSIASGTYFYDNAPNAYSVQNRNFTQQQQTTFSSLNQNTQAHIRPAMNTQVHGIVSNQQMRFNSVMVLEQNRSSPQIQQSQITEQQTQSSAQQLTEQIQQQMYPTATTKISSSPRPSILRKRDHEGSPLKAAKNLVPILSQHPQVAAQAQSLPPASPPSRPDSRGNGHSSGGSTTISATSSPGLAEVNEDSNHAITNNKEEEETKPPMEMSPRKKPRKQQLTGNDLDENKDDMQFISDHPIKKDDDSDMNQSDEPKDGAPEAGQVTTVRKPASASLLNSYRQNWKATHNHYLRHADVKPKDERRPTIMDLANQYRVQDKVNGWKIHHLSTQMEDLADQEQTVYNQLTELLKCTESEEGCKQFNKEINRINELIKGNLQRIKIINDGMVEAKSSIMKIFDHKVHVTDIINRCASKRNFKKREKS